jgi:hypothetical protein
MEAAAQEMTVRAAVAIALALLALRAIAQPQSTDCAKQPAAERAKCEQAARVAALCGDFAGAARAACERHFVESPPLDDCARLDGYGRSKCESYNQALLAEYPCAGKAGATLAVCAREQAQKVPPEK